MKEMLLDESTIRPATVEDARSIEEVHVASWKTTYRNIFLASLLEGLSVDQRETGWKEILSQGGAGLTLVACDSEGQVIGFASCGAERIATLSCDGVSCDGELQAIYLLESVRGQGLGTLVVRRVARELQSRGFSSMVVWVLALNPYRKFYEALGGVKIGEKTIERGGQEFVEVAYGWQDLSFLEASQRDR